MLFLDDLMQTQKSLFLFINKEEKFISELKAEFEIYDILDFWLSQFLSMKLEAVNSRMNPGIEVFPPKDVSP